MATRIYSFEIEEPPDENLPEAGTPHEAEDTTDERLAQMQRKLDEILTAIEENKEE